MDKSHRDALIARIAHEVNRAYCETIGDSSQLPWNESPRWQQESAIDGVNFVLMGDHSPEASHANWMKMKIAEGWTYGEVKDPIAKTHPCLLPYEELPATQRYKDHLFGEIVMFMDRTLPFNPVAGQTGAMPATGNP